jgi:hypothetical protein
MLAMREAVKEVILRHKKEKLPLAVWDNKKKKVVLMSPATALRKYNKAIRSESGM